MELFKNTRLKIGNFILAKRIEKIKRRVFYSDINGVKNIGIVWDASNPEEFVPLSKFYQKMLERNINVKIFGYFPGKELPYQYTAIRYLTCIRKKDINLFYIPGTPETTSFINTQFEILIEVNSKDMFPVRYISALSSASFKVGLFESEGTKTPFDMMMQINKPIDIETYISQVLTYLEMINSGKGSKIAN